MRSAGGPPPIAILRLGRVVGACGLAALLAAARPAPATEIEAPITATVTASSSSAAVARALDADALTRWCPASADARGELTIRFARPVKIKKVTVLVGKHDLRKLTAPFHPPIIQASLGQAGAEVDPTENGRNPIELEVFREKQGQVFLLRLEPAARPASDPDERCVSDLEIELDGATWVTGIPDGAASRLARIREQADGGVPCVRSGGPAAPRPFSAPAQGARRRVRWRRATRRERAGRAPDRQAELFKDRLEPRGAQAIVPHSTLLKLLTNLPRRRQLRNDCGG